MYYSLDLMLMFYLDVYIHQQIKEENVIRPMEVDKAFSKIQQPFSIEILRKIEGTVNILTVVNIIKYQKTTNTTNSYLLRHFHLKQEHCPH